MIRARARSPWAPAAAILLAIGSGGCGDSATGPDRRVVAGVDLNVLFAPPTGAELQAAEAAWAARSPRAEDIRVERSVALTILGDPAELEILSHGSDGFRHFGGVLTPSGASPASLPLVIYAHGGDRGIDFDEMAVVYSELGPLASRVVLAAPSYRAETFRFDGVSYASGGLPSPWDRDVDDALAFMDAVLSHVPEADPERIAVVGVSRGGGVALIMAIREPGISGVIEYFGPTDFFDDYVQRIVEDALRGEPSDLPGMAELNRRFVVPLREGELEIEDVRFELVIRSAAYFPERLPAVQIHHGTFDPIVHVSQAQRLAAALESIGRGPGELEAYIYPGGTHSPNSLPGSSQRARAFLARILGL